jgi:hypothetical protein
LLRLTKESAMLALGGVLGAIALLMMAFLTPVLRAEPAPRWSNFPLLLELIAVAIAGGLTVGLTLVAVGVMDEIAHGFDLLDASALVAAMALGLAIWRWSQRRAAPASLRAPLPPG